MIGTEFEGCQNVQKLRNRSGHSRRLHNNELPSSQVKPLILQPAMHATRQQVELERQNNAHIGQEFEDVQESDFADYFFHHAFCRLG